MLRVPIAIRWILVAVVGLGIFAGCLGDDDATPTQTPVVIVPTETSAAQEADAAPTTTPTTTRLAPTATATATPTVEASPTPQPSPTASPTLPPQPTATRAPTSTPIPKPVDAGSFPIPDDPLSILPTLDDLPAGLVVSEEGEADINTVAADFDDEAARRSQLEEWGFQGAVYRELTLPDDERVDAQSQLIGVAAQAILLGSPESAQAEMNSYVDRIFLEGEIDFAFQEAPIDPLGETSRAATATAAFEGETLNFAVVGVTAGSFSLHFLAAGGAQYDPLPDAITAAEVTLDNLGYASIPTLGDVLLQTDFSNWVTNDLESGSLFFGDDDYYHITVSQGNGAFISAYSTDHAAFGDVAVSVDMQMLSLQPDAQGCVLTRVDSVNQQYDYALCVDGAGNVDALYEEFDTEGNYRSEPLIPPGTVNVGPPVDWMTLAIVARGQDLWFVINGQVVGSARHDGATEGAAGVIVNHVASDPSVPAEFIFTNLAVWAVE